MKLYTEEQIRRAMAHSYLNGVERPADYLPIEESILNKLTPIELPSDEDIQNLIGFACKTPNTAINGAKWMKEQILNQNK